MFFGQKEKKLFTLTRTDPDNPLASYAQYPFELEGCEWPSVEHYYQAMKFGDAEYREQIRLAPSPKEAASLGKSKKHQKRKDWDNVKLIYMTRGTYIKCRTYPEVAKMLLDSGDTAIADVSQYDYFWGSGRDMRATNAFGQMLMDIREKLRTELN
jgi:ribA/ribD-fused uncharacterized protein